MEAAILASSNIEASTRPGDGRAGASARPSQSPTPSLSSRVRSGGVLSPIPTEALVRLVARGVQGTGVIPISFVRRAHRNPEENRTSSTREIATEAGIQKFSAGPGPRYYPTFKSKAWPILVENRPRGPEVPTSIKLPSSPPRSSSDPQEKWVWG